MNFSDKKLETAIVVVSLVLVAGLGHLLKSPVQSVLGLPDLSYEMPRPKASFFAALFDLGERAISRQYINPFKDKKAEAKKEAEKKKAENTKSIAQAKKDSKNKVETKNKPKVDVEVYGEDPNVNLGGDTANSDTYGVNQNVAADATGGKNKNKKENETAKDQLTLDQWRALVLAQPTEENIAKMVAAFTSDELAADAFYGIVGELYRDNRPEVQALGLMAAKASYNALAFEVTAQYYASLSPDVQTKAYAYLMSYGSSTRLPALAVALKSNTAEVVELAGAVVVAAYQNSSSGGGSPGNGGGITLDPRASRGDILTTSPANFAQFIPILQELAKSNDADIANMANSALSQMQNLVASI
jgi:hypothetical protein